MYSQYVLIEHGWKEQSYMARQQQLRLEGMEILQRRVSTSFRNQLTIFPKGESQDQIQFHHLSHGKQENLEDRYSCQQVFECGQEPGRQFPRRKEDKLEK
jgi:hypothetical protein